MNKTFSLALALLAATPVLTVARVAQAEQKIAYVDLQRALEETEAGKAARSRLKSEFDKKQKELDARQEELKKMDEQLKRDAAVLKPDALAGKQKELQQKVVQLQETYMRLQKDLSEKEGVEMQRIIKGMQSVIAQIAQAEGVTFVFERNAGLLYAPPSLDLTNELIRKYNASGGGGGGGGKAK